MGNLKGLVVTRIMTKETMEIVANKEVIAINQDPHSVQAKKVRMEGNIEIWAGPLSGYRVVLLLLNRGPSRTLITALCDDIEIPANSFVETRDLWQLYIHKCTHIQLSIYIHT